MVYQLIKYKKIPIIKNIRVKNSLLKNKKIFKDYIKENN